MPSFLEQLLDLLPATSGGYMMNEGKKLEQNPLFVPADRDLSPIVHMPERVNKRLRDAMERYPESENVEDRRVSDKTLKGYRAVIEGYDKAGYTQFPQGRGFARRPTAQEMRTLRAAGEIPQRAAEGEEPAPIDIQALLDLIRNWRAK